MRMRALPYLIGAFLAAPLLIWLALAQTTLQGPQFQAEYPLSNALFGVTVPLVIWFLLSSLGSLANAMAGGNQFAAPRWAPVRWTLRALPALTIVLGLAAGAYVAATEGVSWTVALPLAVALGVAFAIRQGEAARPDEAGVVVPTRRLRDRLIPLLVRTGRGLRRAVDKTPVIGWIVRDAARGGSAGLYLAMNVALLWLVAVWFGGTTVVIWTALLAAPLVFVGLITLIETG